MKSNKYLINCLMIIIITVLCITGCTKSSPGLITTTEIPLDGGEIPLLTIEGYDEYSKFVEFGELPSDQISYMDKSVELPSEFVEYKDLTQFGEFCSLVFLCEVRYGDYSRYQYSFINDEGVRTYLVIDHKKQGLINGMTSSITIEDVTSDMLSLKESKIGKIQILIYSGVLYSYNPLGNLSSVQWEHDNIHYLFGGSSNKITLAMTGSEAAKKLLDIETAVEFTNSFRDNIRE